MEIFHFLVLYAAICVLFVSAFCLNIQNYWHLQNKMRSLNNNLIEKHEKIDNIELRKDLFRIFPFK